MSDTISRQAAIEYLMTNMNWYEEDGYESDDDYKRECITELINGVPSVTPERKTGKWIRHDEIKNVYGGICIECSECGEKYVVQHILDEKYCRNCGAKMEVGENAD